jgi:tyrosyl-tRNA synthetase
MTVPVDQQLRLLTAGAVDVVSRDDLEAKLETGRPLRVKLGIDPTASDIHLGFAVVLRKLRQFQDLGHVAVLILGDFTAQVGDPSGRSVTRPRLSKEQVDAHAETYLAQIGRILDDDPARLEVRRNSEWLGPLDVEGILRLTAQTTVARMLERDDFEKRYKAGAPISLMELLYPLFQGFDSVNIRADVELGGTDQLFNNLMGRDLQRHDGQEPQVVLTLPLLVGLDGKDKMSKSLGNYIGIAEPPAEQFGKVYSVPDHLLEQYLEYATGWDPDRVELELGRLRSGELKPVEAKRLLARTVVDLYHGDGQGAAAEAEFDRVFKSGERPEVIPEYVLSPGELRDGRILLARLLALAGGATSNTDGKNKITQRGVKVNDSVVDDPQAELDAATLDGAVLQVGKRWWARVRLEPPSR